MGMARHFSVACLLVCFTFTLAILPSSARRLVHGHHGEAQVQRADSPQLTFEGMLPPNLAVPAGNNMNRMLLGVGFQIYTYNGSAWALTNVSAELFNFKGIHVGHHFFLGEKDSNGGQATWETFHPASRVTVKAINSVPQNDSIPWLLLEATTTSGSKKLLGSTTIVQRLYTKNGLAPVADSSAVTGQVFESSYSAVYTFSSKQAMTG